MNAGKTNTETIVDLMEFAKSGPLMQAFIIEAVMKYAAQVADHEPEQLDTPMVNGHAWHACAVEARDTLTAIYG